MPECKDCGTASMNQSDYTGTISVSASGKTCQKWVTKRKFLDPELLADKSLVELDLEGAFCRNYDGKAAAWCFVDSETDEFEYCDVPNCTEPVPPTTCGSVDLQQSDYRGQMNVTMEGLPCQAWSSQSPHAHEYTPQAYPEAGLESNYCRNPTPSLESYAWCFVDSPDILWSYCNIPDCSSNTTCGSMSEQQKDYRGSINVTASGTPCQDWSSQSPHAHRLTPENYPAEGLEGNFCRNA